ncbi:threonine/serine exporter family protein [Clostridium guangxiense]|uniref:threonine/serine exporter family protein n=1 Tax=Clostridium guangxiense TaxID=1662055 RepID=UPI001E64C437|nr:threonine/serine exporter family protein [Clostridium guangxiense]MCD2345311.1 threonine/serine exporter family protein [Clostridium guangxiense]
MILNSIYATMASFAFAVLYHIKGKAMIFSAIGGGLGWFVYLISIHYNNSVTVSLFAASITVSIYSEAMARILKKPVTVFILCGIIPLVPGNGMYYTMYETISGNLTKAAHWGFQTFMYAGSIAVAIVFVSSITKLIKLRKVLLKR